MVYLDNDPWIMQIGQDLIEGNEHRLITLDESVAIMMLDTLQHVPDRDAPATLITAYTDAVCSGSYLALFAVQPNPAHARPPIAEQVRRPAATALRRGIVRFALTAGPRMCGWNPVWSGFSAEAGVDVDAVGVGGDVLVRVGVPERHRDDAGLGDVEVGEQVRELFGFAEGEVWRPARTSG